jgi:hypothetical protein
MLLKRHWRCISNSVSKSFCLRITEARSAQWITLCRSHDFCGDMATVFCNVSQVNHKLQHTYINHRNSLNDFRICDCAYWAIKWDSIKDNWRVETILTQHRAIKLHLHKTLSNRNKSIFFSFQDKIILLSKTFQYLSWKTNNISSFFVWQKFGFLSLVESGCHRVYISQSYYF